MDAYGILEKLIYAAIVAMPTAMLSVHFALKKYRSEKWWDKKLSSYLDTTSALNDLILYCDAFLDMDYENMEYPDGVIDSLKSKFHEARLHLQAQVNIGKILYTKETYDALMSLNNKLFTVEKEGEDAQRTSGVRELAEECIAIVTKNAKQDLGIK